MCSLLQYRDGVEVDFRRRLLLKPEIYLHSLAVIFAFIITICISNVSSVDFNDGQFNTTVCVFNGEATSCTFATVCGLLALVSNTISLIVCVCIEISDNVVAHRIVSLILFVHTFCFGFTWFLVFCVLANKWSWTTDPPAYAVGSAQCALAFSFLSLLLYSVINATQLLRTVRGPGLICDASFYKKVLKTELPYTKL